MNLKILLSYKLIMNNLILIFHSSTLQQELIVSLKMTLKKVHRMRSVMYLVWGWFCTEYYLTSIHFSLTPYYNKYKK